MKLIAVLLVLVSLLMLMVNAYGMTSLAGFALWMGGFITSEVICWVFDGRKSAKV